MTEMQFYRQLGRAIADRRKEAGLRQEEVAKAIGLARASLANVENGRQRIMVHQLFKLADALKLGSILDLVPATWHFDDDEGQPELEFRLALVASDDDTAVGKSQTLTDDQQVRVHNLVRAALASGRRGKKA